MPDQKAILGGIPINIINPPGIQDPIEPSIVEHEPAKKSGARLEAMGSKARRTTFTAFFKGLEEWNRHLELIELIDPADGSPPQQIEFIHPSYGLMTGHITLPFAISRNEIENQVSISMTFVRDIISRQRPIFHEAVEEAVKAHVTIANTQAIAETKTDIDDTLGEAGIGIADKIIDFNNTIISEYPDVTGTIRAYVKEVDSLVIAVESTLATITNPVNTFINALDFGTTLPGRIVKAVTQLAERVAILIDDLGTAPENFVNSYRDQILILEETIGIDEGTLGGTTAGSTIQKQQEKAAQVEMQKNFKIAGASAAAVKLAEIYAEDDEKRREIQAAETVETFDDTGKYLGAAFEPQPIMTVAEIENALFASREYLQEAIDLDRNVPALHDIALSLTRNVNQVKIQLEQVKTITVTGTDPLFIIMLRERLPYQMIERVIALNPEMPNINKASGEMDIYAAAA